MLNKSCRVAFLIAVTFSLIVTIMGCKRTTYPFAETPESKDKVVQYNYEPNPQKPVGFTSEESTK